MGTMTIEPDMFGTSLSNFTATKRLGNDLSRLSLIADGRWKVIPSYIKP